MVAGMEQAHKSKWPKALREMAEVVTAAFKQAGKPEQAAQADAFTAMKALAHYFGGRMFYLPTGKTLDLGLRDEKIWSEFNGSNVAELSKRYNLTEQAVYRILAAQRKARRETA